MFHTEASLAGKHGRERKVKVRRAAVEGVGVFDMTRVIRGGLLSSAL